MFVDKHILDNFLKTGNLEMWDVWPVLMNPFLRLARRYKEFENWLKKNESLKSFWDEYVTFCNRLFLQFTRNSNIWYLQLDFLNIKWQYSRATEIVNQYHLFSMSK